MMFGSLYEVKRSDRAPFGVKWRGPDRFRHGEWHLVAEYPKDPSDSDGFLVRLYECRMPARFYKVEAVATANSVGEVRPGFVISTGAGGGMLELAIRLAEEASKGMIGTGAHGEVEGTGRCGDYACEVCGGTQERSATQRIRDALELLDGMEPEEESERAILSGAFEALVDLEGRHGAR